MHRHRFHDDQSDFTHRKAQVTVADVLIDIAIFARESRDHRGQHNTVGKLKALQLEWLEEFHRFKL